VHWQLQATPEGVRPGAPVGLVRFVPETVEPAAAYADGLWGGGGDERVDRGVARVQAMLGFDAVKIPVLQGGRAPADRQALVTWGERPAGLRPIEQPWPGRIPAPAPTRVFTTPWATSVVAADGRPVLVDARGAVNAAPERFHTGARHGWRRVRSWAGPWPVDEGWWSGGRGPVARFQVVDHDGSAWLLRCDGDQWWTEAAYE
jgi:protein ImuB